RRRASVSRATGNSRRLRTGRKLPLLGGPTIAMPDHGASRARGSEAPPHRMHGWQRHTTSSFMIELFSGDHFFVSRQQESVLRTLESALSGCPFDEQRDVAVST